MRFDEVRPPSFQVDDDGIPISGSVYLHFRISDSTPIGLLPENEQAKGSTMEYFSEVYGIRRLGRRGCAYKEALARYADNLMLSERAAELRFVHTDEGLRLYEAFRTERMAEGGTRNIF
ncbi:MAG: hypothetical protein ACRD1I_05180 [Terriglobia bacterium]